MNFSKRNLDIIIIVIVGFALRFIVSITDSYSNDELSAVNRLEYNTFGEMLEFGVKTGDMHPAGIQVFMKAWSQIGGLSEVGMRFPFVLFGTISIVLLFLIGQTYINRNTGIIAAIFLSLLYFPIMNSEFARPYSPGLMFSLLAAWYYLKILFNEGRSYKHAIFLGLSLAAAMYTHYFAFMFVAWLGVSGLIFLNRKNAKHILIAGMLAIVLFLPHISITQYHLNVGGLQWLGPPGGDWLFQFIFHAFNDSWWVLVGVIILMVLSLVIKEKIVAIQKRVLIISAVWFFGIYLVGHVYSLISTPVLKFPVMLFALPFLLLLIAFVLSKFKYQAILVSVLILLIGSSTIKERDLFGNRHHELFEEIAEDIVKWNHELGAENIYTVYNLNNPNYMNFYANQWDEEIDFDWDVIEFGDAPLIREDLFSREENYCIVGYSARLTLTQVFETCKEFYPNIIDYKKYNNSAVFLLSKKGKGEYPQNKAPLTYFYATSSTDWDFNTDRVEYDSLSTYQSASLTDSYYVLDSDNPYGPDFEFNTNQIEDFENKYVKVSVLADVKEGGLLTASISATRDGEAVMYRGEPFWEGRDLERMITTSGKGYFTFRIPEYIKEDDVLKISCWNRNGDSPINIRSIEVWVYDNIWN